MIVFRLFLILFLFVCSSIFAANEENEFPNKDSPAAKIYRGSIVYQNYCMACHGVTAEGDGRKAKMYTPRPYNLRKSLLPDDYKEQIIRKGGKVMGRSEFMPPWGEELTDEQIMDIISFLRSIATANKTN